MYIRNEATGVAREVKFKSDVVRAGQHVIPNPIIEYVHQAMFDVVDYIDGPTDDLDRGAAIEAAKILLARCQGLEGYSVVCEACNNPPSTADHTTIITVYMKSCLGPEWIHSFSTKEFPC